MERFRSFLKTLGTTVSIAAGSGAVMLTFAGIFLGQWDAIVFGLLGIAVSTAVLLELTA